MHPDLLLKHEEREYRTEHPWEGRRLGYGVCIFACVVVLLGAGKR